MGAFFFIIIHDKDSLIFTLQERLRFLDGAGGKFTTFEFLTVGKEEEDLLLTGFQSFCERIFQSQHLFDPIGISNRRCVYNFALRM